MIETDGDRFSFFVLFSKDIRVIVINTGMLWITLVCEHWLQQLDYEVWSDVCHWTERRNVPTSTIESSWCFWKPLSSWMTHLLHNYFTYPPNHVIFYCSFDEKAILVWVVVLAAARLSNQSFPFDIQYMFSLFFCLSISNLSPGHALLL